MKITAFKSLSYIGSLIPSKCMAPTKKDSLPVNKFKFLRRPHNSKHIGTNKQMQNRIIKFTKEISNYSNG
jgi:hypothetical protein